MLSNESGPEAELSGARTARAPAVSRTIWPSGRQETARPRVVLADDHALVLAGLKKLVEPEFDVVATVEDGRALVRAVSELKPDVVLLGVTMPLLSGLDAARQIRGENPSVKLIFVTVHADLGYVTEAFRAGASGYILKRSPASELAAAMRAALRGETYVTPLVRGGASSATRPSKPPVALTARQREVLQLVAAGKSTKKTAEIIGISVKTVEFHKSALMRRLSMHSIAELTRYAVEHGMMEG